MDPNKTIRTTSAGRTAAAARDAHQARAQAITESLMLSSITPAAPRSVAGPREHRRAGISSATHAADVVEAELRRILERVGQLRLEAANAANPWQVAGELTTTAATLIGLLRDS